MPVYKWSQTANSNASADPTINWSEGQAPSTINDSARAMMTALAQYRDDISGAITTAGTSTLYTLTSFSGFDSAADMNGKTVAFTPHVTNGASPNINVDGLGYYFLRGTSGVNLPAGVLIAGTPYTAVFNSTNGEFTIHGFFGNPYNVPLAAGMDYWGAVAPNSSFAFAQGQAISRTTYAALFALVGTSYGGGDGSTTFNLPDKTGRVSVGSDINGLRISSFNFNVLSPGGFGGTESVQLTTGQIPSHSHLNTLTDNGHLHNLANSRGYGNFQTYTSGQAIAGVQVNNGDDGTINTVSSQSNISINNAAAGGGGFHTNVQPSIICNYIVRII